MAVNANPFALTWMQAEASIVSWATTLRKLRIDCTVVPIVRGGLVPATMLAHRLGTRRFKFFQISRTESDVPYSYCDLSVGGLASVGHGEAVVLVDDIVYTGATMLRAIEHVNTQGGEVVAACSLVVDAGHPSTASRQVAPGVRLLAGFSCEAERWVRFPWERAIPGEHASGVGLRELHGAGS